MTLKAGHWRLFAPLLCAIAVFVGCQKADSTFQSSSRIDPKAQIYKHLVKKSGQKDFTPGIDLELPKQVAMLRSNATALEQRTRTVRASLRTEREEPSG